MTAPAPLSSMPRPAPPERVYEALPFLDAKHIVWEKNHEAWEREEARLFGGTVVLDELVPFDWEETNGPHYGYRKRMAHYVNLPKVHASMVTGHVGKKRPKPGAGLSFGTLGDVRSREDQGSGLPTRAEMLFYNVDGIGQDASEWAAWWDGVYERAEATGHRWVMVETPRVDPTLAEITTVQDELAGARPYLVEYSPTRVINWWYHNGELEFAVIRTVVDEPYLQSGTLYMPQLAQRGYYLLVREGCTILGPDFADGGWWLWDSQRRFIANGDWDATRGRIPLFCVFSESDPGTDKHPTISRSQTTELGQCAVGIMNMISARDWDAFNAAMSKTYILGADPQTTQVVIDKARDSQIIPVPAIEKEDGSVLVPTLYDGSQGAVASNVFSTILTAKFSEAQQTMMEKVTSDQSASGAKQAASFAEASSPLLVKRARAHQQAESNAIYFLELRWGTVSNGQYPSGFSEYPDDYELAPIIDDIDAELDTLRRAATILPAKSASLIVDLIMQSLTERGVMPKDVTEEQVRKELMDSIAQAQAQQAAQQNALMNGMSKLNSDVPGQTPPSLKLPPVGASSTTPDGATAPRPANQVSSTPNGVGGPTMPRNAPRGARSS